MTVQLEGNIDRKMTQVIARKPITFHCFIRRLDPSIVPDGNEANWLRDLYQEKDRRFKVLLENSNLDGYKPKFPSESDHVKEQFITQPIQPKSKFDFRS
jgi:hypothetical protein